MGCAADVDLDRCWALFWGLLVPVTIVQLSPDTADIGSYGKDIADIPEVTSQCYHRSYYGGNSITDTIWSTVLKDR